MSSLDELCLSDGHTRLHGLSQTNCLKWLRQVTEPVLSNGRVRGQRLVYDGVLEQWARLFTTYDGPQLILKLLRNMKVWIAFGLDPDVLAACFSQIYRRLRQDREVEYEPVSRLKTG